VSAGKVRIARRRVDGMLLLDKPSGITSNAALQRAKRAFRAEKAGHTGTLDPLASGLLPLCFGDATKFAQSLLDARKEYVATIRFGIATSTGDAEGETIALQPVAFSRADLDGALLPFLGRIRQVPPRHSALKHEGRAHYEYARAGVDIPRVARDVDIGAIDVLAFDLPTVTLRVECGKGTYIRVLAEDLGLALRTCAHLAALRRTASGAFRLEGAVTLAALEALDPDARDALLLPVDAPLAGLPAVAVDASTEAALTQGRTAAAPKGVQGLCRCYGPGRRFLGLVDAAGGILRPLRLTRTDAQPVLSSPFEA
jgi:tRNA pseudouridine55 synthase